MLVAAVSAGCDREADSGIGPHTARFTEVLELAVRDCVAHAVSEPKLEAALASLVDLPNDQSGLPNDLAQLEACTGPEKLREGVARVVLATLPKRRSRLMLEQEDTPEDLTEVRRRLAAFPRNLAERYRFHGFERRGPERLSVAYQRVDVPEPPQSLSVDILGETGRHPSGWTAGELVAASALEAKDRLVAAGVYHGVVWARFVEVADDQPMQVVVWGDVDGAMLFRAEGASREVLVELVRTFRAGA